LYVKRRDYFVLVIPGKTHKNITATLYLLDDSRKSNPTAEMWISEIKMQKWRFFIRRVKFYVTTLIPS